MRKNIFEILKNQEINVANEVLKIEKLFRTEGDYLSLKEITDDYFCQWAYRETHINIEGLLQTFNIPAYDICKRHKDFSPYEKLNAFDMFNYFEIICNLLLLIENKASYEIAQQELGYFKSIIFENIIKVLEKYGYKFEQQQDRIYIIKISEEATAIAENYEDIAEDVIEYKRFSLNGNLKRKRELLYNLSNKFEEIRPNLNQNCQSDLVKDIATILNGLNIRHNNKNDEYVSNLSDDELEMWYDRAYDTMLLAFMQNRYLAYKNDIKELRTTLKTNK